MANPEYDVGHILRLCFDSRGAESKKFVIITGSQISKLATKGRKAASFLELLRLGVTRVADVKYKASAIRQERCQYVEALCKLIPTDPLVVADEIYSQLGEGNFRRWLCHEFKQFKIMNPRPTSALKCLQKAGALLLTTNYDFILENSKLPPKTSGEIPGSDRALNILVEEEYVDLQNVIAGPEQAILHLFGTFESRRKSFVFTKSDHDSYGSNADAMNHLRAIFYNSHVLFVGFQENDPFLNTLHRIMMKDLRMEKHLGSTQNCHYVLVPESDVRNFSDRYSGFLPLPYGSNPDHLVNFLTMIKEATEGHQRGPKRRMDDAQDFPAEKRQRVYMVSPDLGTIQRTTAVIQELGIPKDVVDVAADTGEFASIYFTIDVPEEYIPRIWHEAIRSNNRLVKCGSLAIQIGTGPMLWMRNRFHAPEQPLPNADPDVVDQQQGHGQGWKHKKRVWLQPTKPGEIQQQVAIPLHCCGDQPKPYVAHLKKTLKERFSCRSFYTWSRNCVTFVCQGREVDVIHAVKFLQQPFEEKIMGRKKRKTTDRQFACEDCDVVWWADVPKDNPVTLCPSCKICYKALELKNQYGYGIFQCKNCSLRFEARDRFFIWYSINCPICGEQVRPYRILRPHRNPFFKEQSAVTTTKSSSKPTPNAPKEVAEKPKFLPKYRDAHQQIRRNVFISSEPHDCTGDTDDETKNAGLKARHVNFEFKQEVFHLYL